ncbi:MAG: hypothetical protein AAF791_05525 [Bacteroidota bacterium]
MLFRTLCATLFLFGATAVAAQQVPSWAESGSTAETSEAPVAEERMGPGPPPPPPPPPGVPIDGGLGLLALAGAGYAAHRLRRRRED